MVKEMRFDFNPLSLYKNNKHSHVFVKFAVSLLLLGIAFRLFVSDSITFSFVAETREAENQISMEDIKAESPVASLPIQQAVSGDFQANETQIPIKGERILDSAFCFFCFQDMQINVSI